MKQISLSLCCVFVLASTCLGAEKKGLGSLWPFGRDSKPTSANRHQNSAFGSGESVKKKSSGGMPSFPSPTEMLNKMEQRTGAFFTKTRSTMHSVRDFGRSLIPPVLKSEPAAAPKPQRSISSIFKPKAKPLDDGPKTAADWHSMPRPGF